ncbi:MAG: hypothetical protein QGH37_04735 [Candidatus Poribacteria bacterium]|nr:hypothetical protein [Candidatus Poribacteria bacterium]MDP6999345.1 hypothetical protein [Candidatus Poribacteria bacterium]
MATLSIAAGLQGIKVYGLRLASSGGGGIDIGHGAGEDGSPHCQNIHIKDVVCDDN